MSELPSSWTTATLTELISTDGFVADGDWVETEDQDPSGEVRLTQLADVGDGFFRDRSSRFMSRERADALRCTYLQSGDVLIARMPDPLGRSCVFQSQPCTCVTVVDVCVVRLGSSPFSPRWLMHFVNAPSLRTAIAGLQSGSTRKRISKANLCTVPIRIPPANEQARIVEEIDKQLSRLDAAVASLTQAQIKLKAYRASVLKAAVEGRLVPTEAELARTEGRTYEPADKLLERILRERRRAWEERQLADMKTKGKEPKDDKWKTKCEKRNAFDHESLSALPEGWCWSSLGGAFEVTVGATPSRSEPRYWGGEVPWVSSGEVAFCRIRVTRESITAEGLANSSTKMNPAGSVLIGMIGEGKTRGQAAILDIDACANQNAACIQVSKTEIVPEYVYYVLVGQYQATRRLGSGNNQPALNKSRVEAMTFPLPPLAEQKRIVEKLGFDMSHIEHIQSSLVFDLTRCNRLRQSILKAAFEGQLVDQDPNDEPASALLARLRTTAKPAAKEPKRGRKPKKSA